MPFESKAQQRWAHTAEGTKALGGAAKVAEWDKATDFSHLPARVGGKHMKGSIYRQARVRKPKGTESPAEERKEMSATKRRGGIHIRPANKGKLHRALGVAKGENIPAAKIAAAKNSSSPALRKEATFAQNARSWGHR